MTAYLFSIAGNNCEQQPNGSTSSTTQTSIDFSHVDVGNLTTDVIANIDETELDQYLPLVNSSASCSQYSSAVETANGNSPVNAMYAWSTKFFTSHQNSTKTNAKQSESFAENYENHQSLYNRNGEHQQMSSYDHCVGVNQLYPSYSSYALANHATYGTSFLQWPYS